MKRHLIFLPVLGLLVVGLLAFVSPNLQAQAAAVRNITATCSRATVAGRVEQPARYVRIMVAPASNLSQTIAKVYTRVRQGGRYSESFRYSARQPEGTRLIFAICEWDGSKCLRPATLTGVDCHSGGTTPTPTPPPITPTSTALPPSPTPTAIPNPFVTVSYAEVFQVGPRIDIAAKADFTSSVDTTVSLTGFFVYPGQAVPDESTCGQIPERSLAGPTWAPAPLQYGPGEHVYNDWGYIPTEVVPADATHFVVSLAIRTQPDGAIAYCTQKVNARTGEEIPGLPNYDASSIHVMNLEFQPDVAVVDRAGTFDFGVRYDFESIIMNQVRLLAFFVYQGESVPSDSACMSGQMPGRGGEVFWSTGSSTRFWTGTSHFEQTYRYNASAPSDATHLVMWLMLDDSYNRPILCQQKVFELSPAAP